MIRAQHRPRSPVRGMKHRVAALLWVLAAVFQAPALRADSLVMSGGLSVPPYVIPDRESGLLVDLIRAALKVSGHGLAGNRPTTNQRAVEQLLAGHVDLAIHVPLGHPELFYSQPVLYYRNVAITLRASGIRLRTLADLENHRVVGFQNARRLLGDEFELLTDRLADYNEVAHQRTQVVQLYRGDVDVVVSELAVFRWYREDVRGRLDTDPGIEVHALFEPSPRRVAFRKLRHRDDFDVGLRALRRSGRAHEIYQEYARWFTMQGRRHDRQLKEFASAADVPGFNAGRSAAD